jgi:hypothetical protein
MKRYSRGKALLLTAASITALSCFLSACDNSPPQKETPPPPPSRVHTTPEPPDPDYCPAPNELSRNDHLMWGAPGGFISNTASFSNEITMFVGSQWQGLSNGTIMCVYKGNQDDFSISIQTNRFVEAPWGGMWQGLQLQEPKPEDVMQKSTYVINCISTDPKDCPFPSKTYVWTDPGTATPPAQETTDATSASADDTTAPTAEDEDNAESKTNPPDESETPKPDKAESAN